MLTAREVLELQAKARPEAGREQLEALLVISADGLLDRSRHGNATSKRLHHVVNHILDLLIVEDPSTRLEALMHHPHPEVFAAATARYYWEVDEHVAEDTARAIVDRSPPDGPLWRYAQATVRTFEGNRRGGNTPSTRAAAPPRQPYEPPKPDAPLLSAIDRHQLAAIARDAECDVLVPILDRLAWPSLRLKRTYLAADDLSLGASKLGGTPDMPETMSWPRFRANPLSFLGQVDLSEIAAFQGFTHLPHEGHLFFFYDADLQPWGHEHLEPGSARVLYAGPGASLARRSAPADLYKELQFRPARVEFLEDVSLPGYDIGPMSEDPEVEMPELSEEQFDALERLQEALEDRRGNDNQPKHRMFGFPDGWQDSMHIRWEHEQGPDASSVDCFRMVFQVDSDEEWTDEGSKGMYWGSEGRIHFWIERAALIRGEFAAVEVILQCT